MDSFGILRQALLGRGARLEHVDVRERTLYATKTIAPNEVVLSLPISCCITSEGARDSPTARKIIEKKIEINDEFTDQVFLTIFFLDDRESKKSFYAPYYAVLPNNRHDFPVFWSEEQVAWFCGSSIQASIEGLRDCIKAEYDAIVAGAYVS
eukprot:21374-Amorphochlora_amoeboformis.AAC.2